MTKMKSRVAMGMLNLCFKPPVPPSPPAPPADALVVCMGETVLWVPVKAVRQSLDPAGGAQLQAIINGLPFWPATEVRADGLATADNGHVAVAATKLAWQLARVEHPPPLA